MVPRQVFHSLKVKSVWAVKSDGKTLSEHFTQVESLTAAVKAPRAVRKAGGLAQVVLHKADGEISQERIYGKDPPAKSR